LLKKCSGWECNGFKLLGTRWWRMMCTKQWETNNSVNLLTSHTTVSLHWYTSGNMSVGNHQISSLLIVLRHVKFISLGRSSIRVICSEKWKGVGRNTDYVNIMKKISLFYLRSLFSDISFIRSHSTICNYQICHSLSHKYHVFGMSWSRIL
jgi:hypothetical protein